MKSIVGKLGSLGWLTVAALVAAGACSRGEQPAVERKANTVLAAVDPAVLLATLRSRPGTPVGAGVAQTIDVAAGKLKPTFAASVAAGEAKPANVTLPAQSTGALHLEDAATGVAVDVTLQGALAVAGQVADGFVVYPAAHASGADVLQRPVVGGTEDYLAFNSKPQSTQISYGVTLGAGAAALRLVANTLEVLDSSGAPRLRVAPPFIVGADGTWTDATLAVAGCALDTNPAAPWGRAVTPPGASTCTVKVSWPSAGVSYPAVLDPRWVTTGSMGVARYEHTLTVIASTGKVLAAGGRSSTGSTTGLSSAELYDKNTGTWSTTGSFTAGRRLHSATQLGTSGNATTSGKILIAGGISGTTSLNTAQLYSPSAGTWIAAGNLNAARHAHTETLLADGRVFVAGGLNGTTTLQTAALYNPGSGAGSFAATTGPIPPPGWKSGTATLIQTTNNQLNNKVLLVGGNNGSATLSSVFLFDPVQSAFSTLTSISSPREQQTASVLPGTNGKILVTGGKNGSAVLASALLFDPAVSNGSWSSAGTMTSARFGHSATVLPASIVANGSVLIAGGSSTGSNTLSSAELFSGSNVWTSTPSLPGPMQSQQAVLLGNNMILAAGGLSSSSTVLGAAYLYDASFGLGCSSGTQCPTGQCVNGVCCDTSCSGTCGACNLAGHLGTCWPLLTGTVCRAAAAGGCDVAETCNGSSLTCPTDGFASSSTVCRAVADDCDLAENCSGSSATCPSDVKKANGASCPDDGNACTTDLCNGSSVSCQHAAGNAGAVCRAVAGECDLAETCTGSSGTCPTDTKKVGGTACTDDGNVCTTDTCNGSSVTCQHPAGNAGTVCRATAGVCDAAETCSGSSTACPTNIFLPSSTVCRSSAGVCDVAENCTGSSASCPTDALAPGSTVCRASAGTCDVAENCTGSSTGCPVDAFQPAATVCRTAAGVCDIAESCTGSSAACPTNVFQPATIVCRVASGLCDMAENCTGSTALCPIDAQKPEGAACNDGNVCTQTETCHAGTCQPPTQFPTIVDLPVSDIGTLGGTFATAADVNIGGQIVGTSSTSTGEYHAFVKLPNEELTDIGTAYPLGSSALSINTSGVVAGTLQQPGEAHVFRYIADTGVDDLGFPGDGSVVVDLYTYAGAYSSSINDVGQIGGLFTDSGTIHGFRYTDGGGFEDIGALSGGQSTVAALSDAGTAYGSSRLSNTPETGFRHLGHAVAFDNSTVDLMDLNDLIDPLLDWTLLSASDASNSYVVGVGDHDGVVRPFRMRDGVIDELTGGWEGESTATGVNASGDVVGWGYVDAAGLQQAAFVYTDQIGFKNLNDLIDPALGWDLRVAASINQGQEIVGWGYHNGQSRAFRLSMAPRQIACGSPNTCGGGNSGEICLWADGIVDTGDGHFIAVFGFQSSHVASFHPAVNQVRVNGTLMPSFQPAPPEWLATGIHAGAFTPKFDPGQTISWTVDGKTASASATSSRILPPVPIGTNGFGVMIGGILVTIHTDTGLPSDPTLQPEPAVGEPFNGVLAGQLTVGPTGAAVYTVPIKLPPGIAGMAPNLSLVYNSQGGNGLAGQGWELTGLSTIHRCPKTLVQDGYNRPVHMNNLEGYPALYPAPDEAHRDGICVDGKRLFLRQGTTDTYDSESKDFTVITRKYDDPNIADGAATSFTILTKTGETRFYGSTTKSRVLFPNEDDFGNLNEIAIWALDRVVDVWGNYYDVHYNNDLEDFTGRGLIVTSIDYTGHFSGSRLNPLDGTQISVPGFAPFTSVSFDYEGRPDPRHVRFRKSGLWRYRRLKTITTDAGTYDLSYLPNQDSMLPSRLTSIGYRAKPSAAFPNGQPLKSLDFGWDGGGYEWQEAPVFALPGPIDQGGTQFVDLDGDGRVDFVSAPAFEGSIGAWKNTGTGWSNQPSWLLPGGIILADQDHHAAKTMFADMDGDGLPDLVASTYSCTETCAPFVDCERDCHPFPTRVWLNRIKQGGTWESHPEFNNGPMAADASNNTLDLGGKDALADLNHDGRVDLVRIGPNQYQITVFYNTTTGWSAGTGLGGVDNGLIVGHVNNYHFEDINRDGLPDLVGNYTSSEANSRLLYFGPNPAGKLWGAFPDNATREFGNSPEIADIDGDGRYDRMIGYLNFFDGDGETAGMYTGVAMATGLGVEYWKIVNPANGNTSVTGTSAIAAPYATAARLALINPSPPSVPHHFNLPDLNGDGLADLVVGTTGVPPSGPTNFLVNTGNVWSFPTSATASQNVPLFPAAVFVDLDGDGIADIVQSLTNGPNRASLNKFRRPAIKTFPQGLAQPTEIEYAIITKSDAQTQGIYVDTAPLDPGSQYLAMPIQVVASVARDDGLGFGSKPKTFYKYQSLRGSAYGRGPQGFRQVTVVEPAGAVTLGTTTVTTLAQAYPYTGLPTTVARSKGSKLLTSTSTLYCDTLDTANCTPITGRTAASPYPPKASLFVYPASVVDAPTLFNGDQPAGTMLTASTFVYDAYGNPTDTRVTSFNPTTGETIRKITTNEYTTPGNPDGLNGLKQQLGKVTKTTVESQRLFPSDGNNSPIIHVTEFEYSQPNSYSLPPTGGTQYTLALTRTKTEPNTISASVLPAMTNYIAQYTAFEYDGLGNLITTTACGSDFGNCKAGAVNPSNPSDPAHPPFRTTRVSYDPTHFNAPVGQGLISSLSYAVGTYSGAGRFPVRTTNAAGHLEFSAFDPVKGVLLQKTGPNGTHTCFTYDDLGHQKTQVDRCGVANLTTTVDQFFTTIADPYPAAIVTVTRPPSGATSWVYVDALERKLATLDRSFGGGFTEIRSTYDNLGRVASESKPFFLGDPVYFTTPHYDALGRIDSTEEDLGRIDTTGNSTFKTTATSYLPSAIRTDQSVSGGNQYRIETKNALGKVAAVTDSNGVTIRYWYDADGNLTDAGDPVGHNLPTVHVEYDSRGRKIRTVDPDLGTWTYAYNAFGELIGQTDAKGNADNVGPTVTMTYDVLGRMTTKTDSQGTATWVFDVASGAGVGKLAAMVGPSDPNLNSPCSQVPYNAPTSGNRAARWFTYTPSGEVHEGFDCVEGEVFSTEYEYDPLGRQKTVTYPTVQGTRLAVGYHYTSVGHLNYVVDASNNSLYWAATEMNALGQVTAEHTRNGVETIKSRNPSTGWLTGSSSIAHADGNAVIEGWAFSYDEAGNVRSRTRQDALIGGPSVETFGYDALNRVTSSEVSIASGPSTSESYSYDTLGLGNLREKSGQTYTYTGCSAGARAAGPHAVCTVGNGAAYQYDDNGNVTSGGGRTFSYNHFNKPIQIAGEQGHVEFAYGADGNRVLQAATPSTGGSQSTPRTVYVGLGATGKGLYERTTRGDGSMEHVEFIYAGAAHGGSAFALRVTTEGASSGQATKYHHFDHLGSITAVSDENGHVVGPSAGGSSAGTMGYDPWGARRNPDGQATPSTSFALPAGHRGYTGHETIPEVGLVNMNGRVYDATLGRFLSPDPSVQFATNLQNYNRYSYVLNNPLRDVDPTGYEINGVGFTINFVAQVGLFAGTAVACAGTGGAACGAVLLLGVAWNTTTMAASGASFGQTVAVTSISLFSGFVGGGVGSAIGGEIGSSFAGALIGGAIGGGLGTALTTGAFGGHLGWNVLEGAALGAAAAGASWAAREAVLSQAGAAGQSDEGETSGAMRVEVGAKRDAVTGSTSADHPGKPGGGPTAAELKKNPVVSGALQAAYADTNAGNPKLAHEEGGWVYMNDKTKQLIPLRAKPGKAGTGSKGYFEIDLNNPPQIKGYVVVGTFHAHPLTINQLAPVGRWPRGPSLDDDSVARKQGVPGLVYDPSGTYTYGPDQRLHLDNGLGFPGWGTAK